MKPKSQFSKILTSLAPWLIGAFIFICLHIITLIYAPFHGFSDFQFYFEKALQLTNDTFKSQADLFYAALFPTTVLYPLFLSIFMHIFGAYEMVGVVINQLLVAALAIYLFHFLQKLGTKWYWSLIITLAATLNPITAFYANSINAEIPFGVFILFAFLFFCEYIQTKKLSKIILTSLFLLIANLFRPLAIIMFILMLVYLIIELIIKRKEFSQPRKFNHNLLFIIYYLLFIVIFFLPINSLIIKYETGFPPPASSYGWNLYVGMSEDGIWNVGDATTFDFLKQQSQTPTEVMTWFKQQGIYRLEYHNFSNTWTKLDMFKQGDSIFMLSNTHHPARAQWLNNIVQIYFIITILASLGIIIKSFFKRNKLSPSIVLALYFLLSVCSFIFLEAHQRYAVSYYLIYPIIIFFAVKSLDFKHEKIK